MNVGLLFQYFWFGVPAGEVITREQHIRTPPHRNDDSKACTCSLTKEGISRVLRRCSSSPKVGKGSLKNIQKYSLTKGGGEGTQCPELPWVVSQSQGERLRLSTDLLLHGEPSKGVSGGGSIV